MIQTKAEEPRYLTTFSNGTHTAQSDTTADKGGAGAGFRPHELLEAALGACTNMTVRMYAERHNVKLTRLEVTVKLDRSTPGVAVFRYHVDAEGEGLTPELRARMLKVVTACPVRKTLSGELRFEMD